MSKDTEKIRAAVQNKVPEYMIPDKIVRIGEMPKNANGKIDRKALTNHFESYVK